MFLNDNTKHIPSKYRSEYNVELSRIFGTLDLVYFHVFCFFISAYTLTLADEKFFFSSPAIKGIFELRLNYCATLNFTIQI